MAAIIVLNIGLDLHVILPALFTMRVLMALATAIATPPALQLMGVPAAGWACATIHQPCRSVL